MSRRWWLRGAAVASAAAAALADDGQRLLPAAEPNAGDSKQDSSPIIDAHVHVWTADVARFPLAMGFAPRDMRPASFTPQELCVHSRPAGVSRVVLIQMNYYGFDNSYMLAAIRDFPGVFSGVAVVDHLAAGLAATMRGLKTQGVRGFRIHAGMEAVDRWLFAPQMKGMWRLAADEGLAMCALVNPDALVPLDAMSQEHRRTTLVVDHFARIGMDGTIRQADLDRLCRLARHPNVYVKVSAFYALGRKQPPYTDLGPMIRRLLDAFGRERLMWASDCPFQVGDGHNYRDSIELIRSRLDFLAAADRQWLLGGTARRVYFD